MHGVLKENTDKSDRHIRFRGGDSLADCFAVSRVLLTYRFIFSEDVYVETQSQ